MRRWLGSKEQPEDTVRRAYLKRFGKPSRQAPFRSAVGGVEIWKWDADRTDQGVALYLTIGASRIVADDGAHRAEFHLGLLPAKDDVVRWLADIAVDPIRGGAPLTAGHSVTFPEPLWPGTRMRTLMVVRPGKAPIEPIALGDRTHIQMLGLVPIYASELELKKSLGFDALWSEFARQDVATYDPGRPVVRIKRSA